MISIKDKLLEIDTRFICLREILVRLAQLGEGCTLAEAARYLQVALGRSDSPPFQYVGPSGQAIRVMSDTIDRLLVHVMVEGVFEEDDDAYAHHCAQRSVLYLFLARDGVVLDPAFDTPESLSEDHFETVPPPPKSPWPWGSYTTKRLESLKAAAQHFWASYDPIDTSRAPTNEEVTQWLIKEHDESQSSATAIATILRADGLKTGPRPPVVRLDPNSEPGRR